jgi:hypothetical protein
MDDVTCISCGMPLKTIEDRPIGHPESEWCRYCSRPDGSLQEFSERFERMVQWEVKKKGRSRPEAEAATRVHMKTLPAWKDHPSLQ